MSEEIVNRHHLQEQLTVKEALGRISQRLTWYGPQTLRVGRITAVGESLLIAEITTGSGRVVRQAEVDRSTGEMRLLTGFSRTALALDPPETISGRSTRQHVLCEPRLSETTDCHLCNSQTYV